MGKAKAKRDLRIPLHAVVYQHAQWWIAHCLELDLVAEGKTADGAIQDLMELSETQLSLGWWTEGP